MIKETSNWVNEIATLIVQIDDKSQRESLLSIYKGDLGIEIRNKVNTKIKNKPEIVLANAS